VCCTTEGHACVSLQKQTHHNVVGYSIHAPLLQQRVSAVITTGHLVQHSAWTAAVLSQNRSSRKPYLRKAWQQIAIALHSSEHQHHKCVRTSAWFFASKSARQPPPPATVSLCMTAVAEIMVSCSATKGSVLDVSDCTATPHSTQACCGRLHPGHVMHMQVHSMSMCRACIRSYGRVSMH
jgi:hypothetical protein